MHSLRPPVDRTPMIRFNIAHTSLKRGFASRSHAFPRLPPKRATARDDPPQNAGDREPNKQGREVYRHADPGVGTKSITPIQNPAARWAEYNLHGVSCILLKSGCENGSASGACIVADLSHGDSPPGLAQGLVGLKRSGRDCSDGCHAFCPQILS